MSSGLRERDVGPNHASQRDFTQPGLEQEILSDFYQRIFTYSPRSPPGLEQSPRPSTPSLPRPAIFDDPFSASILQRPTTPSKAISATRPLATLDNPFGAYTPPHLSTASRAIVDDSVNLTTPSENSVLRDMLTTPTFFHPASPDNIDDSTSTSPPVRISNPVQIFISTPSPPGRTVPGLAEAAVPGRSPSPGPIESRLPLPSPPPYLHLPPRTSLEPYSSVETTFAQILAISESISYVYLSTQRIGEDTALPPALIQRLVEASSTETAVQLLQSSSERTQLITRVILEFLVRTVLRPETFAGVSTYLDHAIEDYQRVEEKCRYSVPEWSHAFANC